MHNTVGRRGGESTHCKHGHKYTPANTAWVKIRKWTCRRCKTCYTANGKKRYREDAELRERKKASARAYWHNVRKFQTSPD